MREIKLRVHCKETGRILAYEYFNQILNWGYFWTDPSEPEDEAICHAPPEYFKHPQDFGTLIRVLYTGLKDKNGVEIYEGDIVRHWSYGYNDGGMGDKQVLSVVEWDEAGACFENCIDRRRGVEVVGNIYQNEDLLEG